jgi:predicted negative regulator of RcsB-dependent stress response
MDSEWLRDLGVWIIFGLTLAVLRFLAWPSCHARKQQARERVVPPTPK